MFLIFHAKNKNISFLQLSDWFFPPLHWVLWSTYVSVFICIFIYPLSTFIYVHIYVAICSKNVLCFIDLRASCLQCKAQNHFKTLHNLTWYIFKSSPLMRKIISKLLLSAISQLSITCDFLTQVYLCSFSCLDGWSFIFCDNKNLFIRKSEYYVPSSFISIIYFLPFTLSLFFFPFPFSFSISTNKFWWPTICHSVIYLKFINEQNW